MSKLSRALRRGLSRVPVLGPALRAAKRRRRIRRWRQAGSPQPPVHAVKEACVIAHAHRFGCRVFVETGTFHGDMVEAMRTTFERIVSIELSSELHGLAERRFRRAGHVQILHGDSATVLVEVLRDLREPALFWLDAHYSMGRTARGELATPISQELAHVLEHPVEGHVVLIDDAHQFADGSEDYPTLDEVRARVTAARPDWTMEVEDDIIRVFRA